MANNLKSFGSTLGIALTIIIAEKIVAYAIEKTAESIGSKDLMQSTKKISLDSLNFFSK